MSVEYVSLYQVIKEFAEEEKAEVDGGRLVMDDKVLDTIKFQTYRKKRQAYVEEIFEKAKVLDRFKIVTTDNKDPKKKEVEFQIPFSQKEYVKFLLRQYADAVSRKIRKDKIDKIKTEEVEETLTKLENLINEHVPATERPQELDTAYRLTQIQSRKAFDEVETGFLKLVGDDLSQVKLRPASRTKRNAKIGKNGENLDKEVRIGNDSDAAFLIYYYYYLMRQQSEKWNEIVDAVAELRFEECEKMADCVDEKEEDGPSQYQFCDIRAVVLEAKMLLFKGHAESVVKEENEPSPEQLCAIEKLLRLRG